MNDMTRQSVINSVYAALRVDKNERGQYFRDSLRVMSMLYELGVTVDEAGYAAEKFGDLPVGTVDSR
jgi:hypothetical protein